MKPLLSLPSVSSAVGLLMGSVLLADMGLPLRAQDRCQIAISFVRNDVQNRLGAEIGAVTVETDQQFREKYLAADRYGGERWAPPAAMMQQFRSPFRNRNQIVTFSLKAYFPGDPGGNQRQNAAAEDIMRSPRLIGSYAERIITACSGVASVKFFFYESSTGWSLHPGNVLRLDQGKLLDHRARFRWGENPGN
jgi:hypothetical protein